MHRSHVFIFVLLTPIINMYAMKERELYNTTYESVAVNWGGEHVMLVTTKDLLPLIKRIEALEAKLCLQPAEAKQSPLIIITDQEDPLDAHANKMITTLKENDKNFCDMHNMLASVIKPEIGQNLANKLMSQTAALYTQFLSKEDVMVKKYINHPGFKRLDKEVSSVKAHLSSSEYANAKYQLNRCKIPLTDAIDGLSETIDMAKKSLTLP